MSLEELRALMRTYMPGRRVRLKDHAAAARRDKVPEGVEVGIILNVVPLPLPPDRPVGETIHRDTFGINVEIETAPGQFDSLILRTEDVEPEPIALDQIRNDLWHREVNFPRSTAIGIDFPPGAGDYGVIDDVRFRRDDEDRLMDLVVALRVAVDPAANPDGINTFYVEADFIQCLLLQRKPPK
jgi:hypothetical protein